MQWVQNEYEKKGWIQNYKQLVQFDEPTGETEPSITLCIPPADSEEQKKWFIQPLDIAQVRDGRIAVIV